MLHLYLYLQSYLFIIMGAWFHIQEDPIQKYYKKQGQYKCLLRCIVSINTVRKLIKYFNLQSIQYHAKKDQSHHSYEYATLSQSPSRRTCCSHSFAVRQKYGRSTCHLHMWSFISCLQLHLQQRWTPRCWVNTFNSRWTEVTISHFISAGSSVCVCCFFFFKVFHLFSGQLCPNCVVSQI